MSLDLSPVVGDSVLRQLSPGQVKKPLSLEERLYLAMKTNLDISLIWAQNDVRDHNVDIDRLDEARGHLVAAGKDFYAVHNGLPELQKRKTQDK